MKLGDATVNIANVFSGENQYQVPFYQRRYVWDNVNWGPLWEDIIQLPNNHFAGTIITYEQANKSIEIVDGQQRLTTFQIIFCVIRDLSNIYDSRSKDIDEWKNEIRNYIIQSTRDNSKPSRIVPTKRDTEAFNLVFSGECWKNLKREDIKQCLNAFESLQNNGKHPIISAYGFFGAKIITYLNQYEDSTKKFEKFQKLADTLKNFRVIKAELDSESGYDPEEIFQIINDTGRKLDDFDYLRNYLFLRTKKYLQNKEIAESKEIATELETLYNDHWDKFEDWDSDELNLFFKAFLMAKLGPTYFDGEDKDIQPFDYYRKHIGIIEREQDKKFSPLLQLSCYAASYESLNSPTLVARDSDLRKLGNRMRFYDALKLPRLDWFLLFMKGTPESSDSTLPQENSMGLSNKDLNNLCNILESYIVRRWLCDNNYEFAYECIKTFFSNQLEFSDQLGDKPSVEQFVEVLSDTWPCPTRVQEVLRGHADTMDPNLVLYILYRIELWKREYYPTPLNFSGKLDIEQLVSSKDLIDEVYDVEAAESRSLDESKKLTVKANEAVKSIGNIKSSMSSPETGWNMEDILKRTTVLLERFDEIWKPKSEDFKS